MARPVCARLRVAGTLVTNTALHVGGLDGGAQVDLPVARNGAGQVHVPGTSLAGALRAWARAAFDEDARVAAVFGSQDAASRLVVEDAPIVAARIERRDGVGIDRCTGAAARRIKYDRHVLSAGAEIPLRLTLELVDKKDDPAETLLLTVLAALRAGRIDLGAGQTRGLGSLTLKPGVMLRRETLDRAGILALVRAGQPDPYDVEALTWESPELPEPGGDSVLRLEIDWQPDGPLMVRDGDEGTACDAIPLTTLVGGERRLVVPGASVKGALRAHAERIVRTVMGTPISPETVFLDQVQVPLVDRLFGAASEDEHADLAPGIGRGALTIRDCHGRDDLTGAWSVLAEAVTVTADLMNELAKFDGVNKTLLLKPTAHVAIDRWTGGAADGKLFTVLEADGVAMEPLTLTIDLRRLGEKREAVLALLILVLRDLLAGRIAFGGNVTRGCGTIVVSQVRVTAVGEALPWSQRRGPLDVDAAFDALRGAWGTWHGQPVAAVSS